MLAIVAAVLVLTAFLALVVQATAARHHAQSAADLAALAAASEVIRGGEGCGIARDVAERNAAQLIRCEVVGQEVIVAVRRPVNGVWAQAAARAGPG